MTKVFISWSGEQSKRIAEELRNWIPSVLQFAKPYYTPDDIEKGTKWSSEISTQLAESNIGIICLTKENLNRPWILFEAGALSKDLKNSKVCSVLFGLENTDISGPLTTFQATAFNKTDFKKMMRTVNDSGAERSLDRETFDNVFEKWWPDLLSKITAILKELKVPENKDVRTDRELLEEILTLSRSRARSAIPDGGPRIVPAGLISELLDGVEAILAQNRKELSTEINNGIGMQLNAIQYLTKFNPRLNPELVSRIDKAIEEQNEFIPF